VSVGALWLSGGGFGGSTRDGRGDAGLVVIAGGGTAFEVSTRAACLGASTDGGGVGVTRADVSSGWIVRGVAVVATVDGVSLAAESAGAFASAAGNAGAVGVSAIAGGSVAAGALASPAGADPLQSNIDERLPRCNNGMANRPPAINTPSRPSLKTRFLNSLAAAARMPSADKSQSSDRCIGARSV